MILGSIFLKNSSIYLFNFVQFLLTASIYVHFFPNVTGANADIWYSITGGDTDRRFSVNAVFGDIAVLANQRSGIARGAEASNNTSLGTKSQQAISEQQ